MKYRTIVAAAIADIREARQSHVDWADWLEEHPEDDSSQVGDAPYHREWVTKYDNVLSVLDAIDAG